MTVAFSHGDRFAEPPGAASGPHIGQALAAVTGRGVAAGSFSMGYDPRAGQVRIIGKGCWDLAMAQRHFAALAPLLDRIRASGAPVRALVDLRESGVQADAVMECIRLSTARLYGAGDRVAIVVASSVLKPAMRHVAISATCETFLSPSAAETWLMAYA